MRRIVIHWTGGGNKANASDKQHYHFIIEGNGKAVSGIHTPEANLSTSTPYAAHVRGLNTGSIGVALAGMAGAKERPFSKGRYALKPAQIDALAELCADLCVTYGIPVTKETVLTHAEVEQTLGVWQREKWDITWLPGMREPGDPIEVGHTLRDLIRVEVSKTPPQRPSQPTLGAPPAKPTQPPTGGLFAALVGILGKLFGGKA